MIVKSIIKILKIFKIIKKYIMCFILNLSKLVRIWYGPVQVLLWSVPTFRVCFCDAFYKYLENVFPGFSDAI